MEQRTSGRFHRLPLAAVWKGGWKSRRPTFRLGCQPAALPPEGSLDTLAHRWFTQHCGSIELMRKTTPQPTRDAEWVSRWTCLAIASPTTRCDEAYPLVPRKLLRSMLALLLGSLLVVPASAQSDAPNALEGYSAFGDSNEGLAEV